MIAEPQCIEMGSESHPWQPAKMLANVIWPAWLIILLTVRTKIRLFKLIDVKRLHWLHWMIFWKQSRRVYIIVSIVHQTYTFECIQRHSNRFKSIVTIVTIVTYFSHFAVHWREKSVYTIGIWHRWHHSLSQSRSGVKCAQHTYHT